MNDRYNARIESLYMKKAASPNEYFYNENEVYPLEWITLGGEKAITEKDTSKILAWIREIRIYKKLQIYFTLDAGPNIHVISDVETQIKFIKEVKSCYPELTFISDTTGSGPTINYME